LRIVQAALLEPGQRGTTSMLAGRYRSMDLTRQAYRKVFSRAWQPLTATRP
jgi:hypothetical protein